MAKLFSNGSGMSFWNLIRDIANLPIGGNLDLPEELIDQLAQGVEQIIVEEINHPGTLIEEQIEQIRNIEAPDWVTPEQPEREWMNRWPQMPPLPPPLPPGVEPAPGTNICPDYSIIEVPPGLEGHGFLRLNQASIDLAKTLPEAPPAKLMPGDLGWACTVPPEFEQLTLDGKITYARKIGERVFNCVLRYADGTQAAVGPANTPLDPGLVLDPAGHVLSYMGTTIEEVEQLKMEQKNMDQVKKAEFQQLRNKWENAERMTQSIRKEDTRLAK